MTICVRSTLRRTTLKRSLTAPVVWVAAKLFFGFAVYIVWKRCSTPIVLPLSSLESDPHLGGAAVLQPAGVSLPAADAQLVALKRGSGYSGGVYMPCPERIYFSLLLPYTIEIVKCKKYLPGLILLGMLLKIE